MKVLPIALRNQYIRVSFMNCNQKVSNSIYNGHNFGTHESHSAPEIRENPKDKEEAISTPDQRMSAAHSNPGRPARLSNGKLNALTVTTLDGANSAWVTDSDTSADEDFQSGIRNRSCTHSAPEHSILDRKQVMNYRRALWVSGPDELQLLSYLAFVKYLGFTARKIAIIFTSEISNDYIIKDESGKLIDSIDNLAKIAKKQPVALNLSYTHKELIITDEKLERFEKGPFDAVTNFFDQLARVDADYFLYSIKVILPSAEGEPNPEFDWPRTYAETEADHVAEIYELVMSSGRSFKGSVGGYFWSKYHAHSFYDSLYNWMYSLHEPGSLADIFTHHFFSNVICNSDWADMDKADNVNIFFHTNFLCAKAIHWYGENYDDDNEDDDEEEEDPYYAIKDKIKSAAELIKQAEILTKEGRNPESFLSWVSPLPHVWKEIISRTGGPDMSYREKEHIVLDFLYNRGFFSKYKAQRVRTVNVQNNSFE